jgi:hypothetical protein
MSERGGGRRPTLSTALDEIVRYHYTQGMTVWSWIYLLLWPVAAVVAARLILEGMAAAGRTLNPMTRFGALMVGLGVGMVWPLWAPLMLLWVGARRFLITAHERQAAMHAELEHLRKQARALGLPLGPLDGEDRL